MANHRAFVDAHQLQLGTGLAGKRQILRILPVTAAQNANRERQIGAMRDGQGRRFSPFKTGALDHSATHPAQREQILRHRGDCKKADYAVARAAWLTIFA